MKQALWLFPLMALVGCSSTMAPKYTVGMEKKTPVEMACGGISVRMASDLRSYSHPLRFKADGTVETIRSLTYYAPLEVALERALRDVSTFDASSHQVTQIVVETYAVVESESGDFVKVSLKSWPGKRMATVQKPIAHEATTAELRTVFAEALYEAFQQLK